MAWTNFPIDSEKPISWDVWQECIDKMQCLYYVEPGTNPVPSQPTQLLIDGGSIPYNEAGCVWYFLRRAIEGFIGNRHFWDSQLDDYYTMTFTELLDAVGTPATSWLRWDRWAGGSYVVGDKVIHNVTYQGMYGSNRTRYSVYECLQDHTNSNPATSSYWKRITPLITTAWMEELRDVMNYLKLNAWIRKNTITGYTGTATPEANAKYTEIDAYSWYSARAAGAGAVNAAWAHTTWGAASGNAPFMQCTLLHDIEHGQWLEFNKYGNPCEFWGVLVLRDCGIMITTATWHADLKTENCEYKHYFYGAPTVSVGAGNTGSTIYRGCIPTPVLSQGTQIGTVQGGGHGGRVMGKCYVDSDYDYFDFTNNKCDITYDDSGWSAFTPPDWYDTTPDEWDDAHGTYYAGELVSHNGSEYQCILEHESSNTKEPGTPGGVLYWLETGRYGWEDGTSGNTGTYCSDEHEGGYLTTYQWTIPNWVAVYIKPDYQNW